ncbi:hypothetical protein RB195_025287 [Necator americanus]|uniref:Reverse transcriptase domain-containing protein n=1 Tax=Necator americanus TaxID=51031 RepID=A0ABR1ERM3_NECAM
MNQRTTVAVRTPAGYSTAFEVITGVRQGAVAGPFLFNFAIDDIMRRTVDQSCRYRPSRQGVSSLSSSTPTIMLYSRKALRNLNMLSTLYRSWLQPMDYIFAPINASRCASLRNFEQKSVWTSNQLNSSMSSVT